MHFDDDIDEEPQPCHASSHQLVQAFRRTHRSALIPCKASSRSFQDSFRKIAGLKGQQRNAEGKEGSNEANTRHAVVSRQCEDDLPLEEIDESDYSEEYEDFAL